MFHHILAPDRVSKMEYLLFPAIIHNIFTLTQRYGRMKSFTDRSQISKSEKKFEIVHVRASL